MKMMAIGTACGLFAALAQAAAAQDRPVVVELYTSQGCSSCPPADDFFATLAADPGVIPLALHVDYWDYIGWADAFASPHFTARQKAYARASGSRTIYTPQLIIDGGTRIEGNEPERVLEAIANARAVPPAFDLTLTREGGSLRIRASARPGAVQPVKVQLVRYHDEETVSIDRGENAGRTVTYRNIVTDWQPVADWAGEPPLDLAVKLEGEGPAVVILQSAGPADIVAAARID
ncbi:DUF1223 domain-containing protein [Gemmobacter denitrificans]|uniref:DUF1223 domain-containing protein n=1 Tax=Gemmobacter denitrificans TaxID=3123040 RepID=A0ABU8BWW6_9RHOB